MKEIIESLAHIETFMTVIMICFLWLTAVAIVVGIKLFE